MRINIWQLMLSRFALLIIQFAITLMLGSIFDVKDWWPFEGHHPLWAFLATFIPVYLLWEVTFEEERRKQWKIEYEQELYEREHDEWLRSVTQEHSDI